MTLRTDALISAGASTAEALTGGFALLFLGTAAVSLIAAIVAGFARKG